MHNLSLAFISWISTLIYYRIHWKPKFATLTKSLRPLFKAFFQKYPMGFCIGSYIGYTNQWCTAILLKTKFYAFPFQW